jgi:hypothetical protein
MYCKEIYSLASTFIFTVPLILIPPVEVIVDLDHPWHQIAEKLLTCMLLKSQHTPPLFLSHHPRGPAPIPNQMLRVRSDRWSRSLTLSTVLGVMGACYSGPVKQRTRKAIAFYYTTLTQWAR